MNRKLLRFFTIVAVVTMTAVLAVSASAQFQPQQMDSNLSFQTIEVVPESENGIYIVQMSDKPAIAYEGGIKGLKATKPRKGKKLDPESKHVIDYVNYLKGKHSSALGAVRGKKKVYDYQYSFNGFAAELTNKQANQLQAVKGVLSVEPDRLMQLDTATTPDFLGLTDPGGAWDLGVTGEDVVIGIVDSGVWPESESFTDRTGVNGNASKDGKLSYHHMPTWHGECRPAEAWNSSHCNQKLIGARYYNAGWGGDAAVKANWPFEYNSPRDWDGHGTHTASTAGGNANTPLTGALSVFGTANGIAPRARIAAYKVCFADSATGGGCWPSDSVAAIDQAVADGVDVINFSISGTRTNFFSSVEIAFLFAADAGVFVAASAGNSGPAPSTVAHPSPWITTVAAGTHDRYSEADVDTGDGSSYTGASTNVSGASGDLVYSGDVGLGGADPLEVAECWPGTLDPALVAGKIVLCDRGSIARVSKSFAVYIAGGIGMIHANVFGGSTTLNADVHSVPTVHVAYTDGDAIRAYATGGGTPTAVIHPSYPSPAAAPFVAGFSSRGPLLAGGGDLLKPDIIAPGQDIIAAVSPAGNGGAAFGSYSGTSMSSPHIAGMGALLSQAYPDWSPMAQKSALMTTATNILGGADPFAQGAGHANPNASLDPGLVFDHGFFDWLDFLLFGGDLTDLNGASVAIGELLGTQTTSRTVTNVSDSTEFYVFSETVPGIDVVATPSSFSIDPGESVTFDLEITPAGATPGAYTSGFMFLTGDNGHVVRAPIVVNPLQIAAPAEVADVADGAGDGSIDVDVTFGYTGVYDASVSGIFPSFSASANITGPRGNNHAWVVLLPANTHFRLSMFDEDTSDPGADDLDLRLFVTTDCATFDFVQLGSSGGFTSNEVIDVSNGPAGCYWGVVDFFAASNGTDTDYTLWFQPVFGDEVNTTLTKPAAAVLGASDTVTVDYTGVAPTRNLGILHHEDGGGEIGRTILNIDGRP